MKKSTLLLLTILLVAFISCKKDDDIEPTIPTVQEGTALISATINDKEIGGSNLSVSSVYYPDAPIKDNSFKTIVSQAGTQVVLVLDDNNSLRGLSYTKKSGNNYELVPIDAASTLISLFLLTPGITTTTSEETLELINNLESLSSYQKLKTEVQNNLPQNNLEQLLAKENINTLFEDVILEYIEKISSNSSTKSAKIDLYSNRLSVMKNKDGMVEISNQAFRRINVYRSYIDNNQVTDSKLLFKSMKGGVGVSWGSLFTFSSFEPTIKVDEEYLPPTQSAITEYWVIGPGNAESNEMPPSYINKDYDQALTETCIYYVLFPMIDLLNGTSKLIDKDGLVQDVFECTKEIRAGTTGLKYFDDMKNASSKKAFNTAMINYTVLIGKTAIAIPAIASSVGVSAGVAGTIGTCLAIISIPMSVANLSAFTADYFKQPKYSKFIIETQLNSPVLLSPTNSSNLQSTSVTFSWEKNPLAWKYVVEISKNSDFEDKIIKTTDGITTTLMLTLEPSTLYYWRVYCTKVDGSPSEYSEVWKFTTGSGTGTISYQPISGNINISHLLLFDSGVTTVSTSSIYGTNFDGFNTFETQNGLYGVWHIFRSFDVISGKLKFNQNSGNWESSSDTDVSSVYAPSSNQILNFFNWNGNLYQLGCSATSGTIYSRVYDVNSSSWVSFSPSMDGVSRFQTKPSVYIDASNTLHGVFNYVTGSVYPQGLGTFYFDPSASPNWQRTGDFAHEYLSTLQTGIEGKWLFFWRDGTSHYIDEYDPTENTIVNRLTFTINDLNGYGEQNISDGTLFKQNNEVYLSFAYTPSGNFKTNGSSVNLGIMKIAELAK